MSKQVKKESVKNPCSASNQYYLDIINCMPNIVYWINEECKLKGCNHNFVSFFGLKSIKDFSGTPYNSMTKYGKWSQERIEAFRLDDMQVLFSGTACYDIEEAPVQTHNGKNLYYLATRVPLLDEEKQIIGLVVILSDITERKNLEIQLSSQKQKTLNSSKQKKEIASPKILMVEDNYVAQKVEEALLASLNCKVDIADSGQKAISLFSPGKYDMVFMDIGLEDTSGYMVAKKIRQMEEGSSYHVPIIALTSFQADVVKYDCYDYSMDGVLSKPLTSEQARQLIQYYVNHENVEVQGLKSAK